MNGELIVLNVGAGDMRFSFNSEDPLEVARARRVVQDMLQRGYLLFVETESGLTPVKGFDPSTDSYIIADGAGPEQNESEPAKPITKRKGGRRKVSAKTTKATGVGPTAGG